MRAARSSEGVYGGGGNNRVLKILTESSSVGSGFSPYGGSTAATSIRDTREREKKEMSDLNDRLASYIEKVRFLEGWFFVLAPRKCAHDVGARHTTRRLKRAYFLARHPKSASIVLAQNRKLAADLEFLLSRWGHDSKNVGEMYEGDLRQAQRVLDEANKARSDLLAEIRHLQDDINSYRRK